MLVDIIRVVFGNDAQLILWSRAKTRSEYISFLAFDMERSIFFSNNGQNEQIAILRAIYRRKRSHVNPSRKNECEICRNYIAYFCAS